MRVTSILLENQDTKFDATRAANKMALLARAKNFSLVKYEAKFYNFSAFFTASTTAACQRTDLQHESTRSTRERTLANDQVRLEKLREITRKKIA